MDFGRRFMNAIRAGIAGFREENITPVQELGWDTYEARQSRYELYTMYRNNTAYSNINMMAAQLKLANKLYKNIRGIYNPVARQNQLLVSYIYGGSIDIEHMTGGAIPLVSDNEAVLDAIRQVFTWSRWGERKSLYVRWGALLGDVGLKIVDDRARGKVRMEVLHPSRIREAQFDEVGNVKSAIIEYERDEETDLATMRPSFLGGVNIVTKPTKRYVYTEKITKVDGDEILFETFKDGKPYAFYTDADGKPVESWVENYGFIPLVIAAHSDEGLKWGANAFYSSLRKVDEINHEASLLNDQIQKIIIPLLFGQNIRNKKEIDVAADDPDKFTVIYSTSDKSNLVPIINQIDIPGALKNIQEMQYELERDLPELALQRVREKGGDFTAPGIKAAFSDAVGRIEEARGNYDSAMVRALQMCISIGGYNQYEGFQGFSLDSYERGDLDFHIKERAVIADGLSLSQRLTFLGTVANLPPALQRLALKEMNYPDAEIDEVVADSEVQVRNAVRGLSESLFGDDTDEDDEDVADEEGVDEEEKEAASA